MTKSTNVTFGDISTQVSNKDAAEKVFNLNANAKINGGKFAGLDGGNFTKVNGNGNGWFSFDQNNNFNFGCNGFNAEEIEAAIKAVMGFYEEVKEAVNSQNA
ncbi:MAG: hypothetical protein J1E16_09690 [Muribaculaceae bacterium]|nr:hypothetical protein [Muribaculaceae bacterium]